MIRFDEVPIGKSFYLSPDMKIYLGLIQDYEIKAIKLSGWEIFHEEYSDFYEDEVFCGEMVEVVSNCANCKHYGNYKKDRVKICDKIGYLVKDSQTFWCGEWRLKGCSDNEPELMTT